MMKSLWLMLLVVVGLVSMGAASNYMYEKTAENGVGYVETQKIVATQFGFEGQKLVEKVVGSGNFKVNSELEAERQLMKGGEPVGSVWVPDEYVEPVLDNETGKVLVEGYTVLGYWTEGSCNFTNSCPMDYINYTRAAEFEYMPISYQTGSYDAKWTDKLCVQNYKIGAVMTEMYTHAEHLVKNTEVRTRGYQDECAKDCCTGVLEANVNSNVIGVAHIGWLSRDPVADDVLNGKHAEYGRSIDDMTGVFSIEKFIQLWGSSSCSEISTDWLPCT